MTRPFLDENKRKQWVAFVRLLNPEIDPKALRLMDEMLMTARALHHTCESSVTATGLSFAKYRILMALFFSREIEGHLELNPSEISERQGTSRNTVSALIRQLEDEELVERSLDQADRRKFKIRLTKSGTDRVHDHVRKHFRMIADCFESLDAGEQETLSRLLAKVSLKAKAAKEGQGRSVEVESGA